MGINLNPADYDNADLMNVLIVGCGNIAGGFDEGRSTNEHPYTHAGAYSCDGRFKLVACIEPNDNRRSEYMAAWNIPVGFRSMDELIGSDIKFDVISICSPTDTHAYDIEIALRLNPKLIFCEKPITSSLIDSERLVKKCNEANIMLAVNYTRRWDPDISKLQVNMQTGEWGELRSVVGIYNKGILNNGSHMLDLLHLLVGTMVIKKIGEPIHDFSPDDQTIPVWLENSNGIPIQLVCGHAEDFTIFEMQFIFSKGVLTMEDGGMFWRERRTIDSTVFKGYRILNEGQRRSGSYPMAMLMAIENIYRSITIGEKLASTGKSALLTQRVCEKVIQQNV